MNSFHRHSTERKQPEPKDHIYHDFIYTMLKNRQYHPQRVSIRRELISDRSCLWGKGSKDISLGIRSYPAVHRTYTWPCAQGSLPGNSCTQLHGLEFMSSGFYSLHHVVSTSASRYSPSVPTPRPCPARMACVSPVPQDPSSTVSLVPCIKLLAQLAKHCWCPCPCWVS